MDFVDGFAYYECSVCGKRTQVLVEQFNEETEEVYYEFDGDASFELVLEHEETHK